LYEQNTSIGRGKKYIPPQKQNKNNSKENSKQTFLFVVVLEFELKILSYLGRNSITRATLPTLYALVI
jgi:hypothetical protein